SCLPHRRVFLPGQVRPQERAASQGAASGGGVLPLRAEPRPRLGVAGYHQDRRRLSAQGQSTPSSRIDPRMVVPSAPPVEATLIQIFRAFLLIGATSFGGGVMAYLRSSLVEKHGWLDDESFVQLLAMSQSLPGLNSTNMAVLVGDRLRGTLGAAVA